MCIPDEINEVEYIVIDDRSEDRTREIAESIGARVISKNFRGDYVSAISETVAFGVENTGGSLILKCDADIQDIPKNALKKIHVHLSDDIRRVSSEVITKTRQNNPLLDFIFFLRYLNFKISLKGSPVELSHFLRGEQYRRLAASIRPNQLGIRHSTNVLNQEAGRSNSSERWLSLKKETSL